MSDERYVLWLSIWRTFVPALAGFLGATAARYGLDLSEDLLTDFLVLSFGTVYYSVARFLEHRHGKRWGWLLGYPRSPRYLRGLHRKTTTAVAKELPGREDA